MDVALCVNNGLMLILQFDLRCANLILDYSKKESHSRIKPRLKTQMHIKRDV